MADIKKAWEAMKKELKKELGLTGGTFRMSTTQMEKRTASYLVTDIVSYEKSIKLVTSNIEAWQNSNWRTEVKEKSIKELREALLRYEEKVKKYGTKNQEIMELLNKVRNSKAFAKFQETAGPTSCYIEKNGFYYYIVFRY